jgi:hypothetical protein
VPHRERNRNLSHEGSKALWLSYHAIEQDRSQELAASNRFNGKQALKKLRRIMNFYYCSSNSAFKPAEPTLMIA